MSNLGVIGRQETIVEERFLRVELALVRVGMKGFARWGKLSLPIGIRKKWQFRHKTFSYHGAHYDYGERGARNVLSLNELGGLWNLTKCGKIRLLGGTHLRVEISKHNRVWSLVFLQS